MTDWKAKADALIAERDAEAAKPRNLYTCADLPRIREIVASLVGVEVSDMIGSCRHSAAVRARTIHAGVSRVITTASLPDIAESLGRSAHSTVVHAVRRFEAMPFGERNSYVQSVKEQLR